MLSAAPARPLLKSLRVISDLSIFSYLHFSFGSAPRRPATFSRKMPPAGGSKSRNNSEKVERKAAPLMEFFSTKPKRNDAEKGGAEEGGAGDGEDPGVDHAARDAPTDGGEAAGRTDGDGGAGDGVQGAGAGAGNSR